MRYWILKGKKKSEYGFENDFEAMLRRRGDTWHSSKMLGDIAPGDRLFVYEGFCSPRGLREA